MMEFQRPMPPTPTVRYKDAGVDIDAADQALERIRRHVRRTLNANVLTSIGAFGAGYRLTGFRQPVLVSSADGVGTKLKIAFLTGQHDTVGEDLVNHCVNDILVQGAAPLFFLDYLAMGKLDPVVAEQVISGIARACKANGCALIGGETAEMPGLYAPGEYDLAGFIVGAVERRRLLTGAAIQAGDVLLGLPSTGLHTNGYSLARKLLFELAGYRHDSFVAELGCTIGQELLKIHRSYVKPLRALLDAGLVKGAAHITGGGLTDNLPRILPRGLAATVDTAAWPELPIFQLLRRIAEIPEEECRRTFNLGIGMVVVVAERRLKTAAGILERLGERFYRIGAVVRLPRGARERVIYQ
jgi:phosphoribosylformylglycinamidine cyclo-ligase